MQSPFRLLWAAALALLISLALAGCGSGGPPGDDEDDDGGSTNTTSSATNNTSSSTNSTTASTNSATASTNSSSSANARFVGTWELTSGQDGSSMYILFDANGTFVMKDTLSGPVHMRGTYTVSGSTATGPLTNPGVGDGEIVATVDGDAMALDFIEHWHDPYKHNLYTGSKI